MERYKGVVTTTGNSEAIRFEKVLFRAHPEFARGGSVTAAVIAPGQLLVSASIAGQDSDDEDPILGAFLSFLANDMVTRPDALQPLSASAIARANELTAGIGVDDDEVFPADVTF